MWLLGSSGWLPGDAMGLLRCSEWLSAVVQLIFCLVARGLLRDTVCKNDVVRLLRCSGGY